MLYFSPFEQFWVMSDGLDDFRPSGPLLTIFGSQGHFGPFWSFQGLFWTIWDYFRPFKAILKPFKTILDLFQTFWPIWVISHHFQTMTDHFGPFLTTMYHFGLFDVILGHFGPFWTMFSHIELFWSISDHFESFQAIWDHIGASFDHIGPLQTILEYFWPFLVITGLILAPWVPLSPQYDPRHLWGCTSLSISVFVYLMAPFQ